MIDPLSSFEQAEDAIAKGDTATEIRISAVLALARGGATELALEKFADYELGSLSENEDALALLGRLLKDRAKTCNGLARQNALTQSADAYNQAWRQTDGIYSGINAATLYTLIGEDEKGKVIAQKILDTITQLPQAGTREDNYYQEATRAEALLLLGEKTRAQASLKHAVRIDPDNHVAHATTLKQFKLVMEHLDQDVDWLDALRPPKVCFFAGRMPRIDENPGSLSQLESAIDRFLSRQDIGIAYGALAAGSDILFAEAFLARGGTLRVVLPCPQKTFEKVSITPFGKLWEKRYTDCLSRAASVVEATADDSLADECAVELAARLGMGQAIECADAMATGAIQVLIEPYKDSFSARFASTWQASHRRFERVTLGAGATISGKRVAKVRGFKKSNRRLATMMFSDLTGFGSLNDVAVMKALNHILTPLSKVLRDVGPSLMHLDSWGDGIFGVFDTPSDAAQAAINLQAHLRSIDVSVYGLPRSLALRIGLHYGPATFAEDPITGRASVFGAQVSYAARIEPLAVPGAILASEAFVAALALEPEAVTTGHYIGRKALKGVPSSVRLFSINQIYQTDPAVRSPSSN